MRAIMITVLGLLLIFLAATDKLDAAWGAVSGRPASGQAGAKGSTK